MGIVSLFTKYKILGDLNKYSLILIYLGFSTFLLLAFSFLDLSYLIFNLIFLLISTYFVYFIVSKKRRARGYDFDGIFPLKEKEYLLVEFSSIYCAGCLPIRSAVDTISKQYSNIQVVQIEAKDIESKYIDLVQKLRLSVTPTICLLNKNGELITKRIAHLNPEITIKNLERVLRDPIS